LKIRAAAQAVVDPRPPGQREDCRDHGRADEAIGAEAAGDAETEGCDQRMGGFARQTPTADGNRQGEVFGDGDSAGGAGQRPDPHVLGHARVLHFDADDCAHRRPECAGRPADGQVPQIAVKAKARSEQCGP